MLFSRGNLMVAKVASENPMDAGINCVHLEPDGSTVAANGKIVMAVGPVDESKIHFPDVGPQATPPSRGLSLPLDLVDDAIKNLPKDKLVSLQHVALTQNKDERKVELTCTDRQRERRVAGAPKPEPYNDWRKIFRRFSGGEPTKVCVDRKDMIHLLQAMESACPDKGNENPVLLEISPDGKGIVLRCMNKETGQRAIGCITAYNTNGSWTPKNSWEQTVFEVPPTAKPLVKVIRR